MMYVYMLRCKDGSLYTGITPDVRRRYAEHCAGKGAKYTKSHPPVSLEAVWQVADKSDALRLEYRIKALTKEQKERLLTDEPGKSVLDIPCQRMDQPFDKE